MVTLPFESKNGREIKNTRHRMLNDEGKNTHYPSRGFLHKWIGKRINFGGRICGFGIPKIRWELPQIYFSDQYVLIRNIVSPEFRIQIDHVWVPYTEEMKGLDLSEGLNIEFQAEIIEYSKKGGFDFTLTNVSNIRIMKRLVFALN